MVRRRRDSKIGVCNYHLCRKRTRVFRCRYCGNYFCREHLKPKPSGMPSFKSTSREDAIFMEEYHRPGGHPCVPYFDHWKEERRQIEKEYEQALDRAKQQPVTIGRRERIPKIRIPSFKPSFRIRGYKIRSIFTKMWFWYVFYFSLVGFFFYIGDNKPDLYSTLIDYFKYPLYILSAWLGWYLPYKLFKKFEHREPDSDLQIWLLKLLAGVFAFISSILLIFGSIFFASAVIATIGKEIGYVISIFLGSMFLGVFLFSAYLMFKYKRTSGVIIHRGEW